MTLPVKCSFFINFSSLHVFWVFIYLFTFEFFFVISIMKLKINNSLQCNKISKFIYIQYFVCSTNYDVLQSKNVPFISL